MAGAGNICRRVGSDACAPEEERLADPAAGADRGPIEGLRVCLNGHESSRQARRPAERRGGGRFMGAAE